MKYLKIIYQNKDGEKLAAYLQPMQADGGKVLNHNSTRYINVCNDANLRPLPELYAYKELCCGCSACSFACPRVRTKTGFLIQYRLYEESEIIEEYEYTGAISMLPDEEGFLYPVVDSSECIRCYKCLSVCPYKD